MEGYAVQHDGGGGEGGGDEEVEGVGVELSGFEVGGIPDRGLFQEESVPGMR